MATAEQYAQWIVANQDKKGSPEFETVSQAYQQARAQPQQQAPQGSLLAAGIDPTEGNSFGQNMAVGAGKALSDTWHGIKTVGADIADVVAPRKQNLSGLVTGVPVKSRGDELRSEYDEIRRRDEPLMNTGGGVVGNVAGNIATVLAPGAAVKGAGMIQGARGATQSAEALNAAGKALMVPRTIVGAGAQGAAMGALQPVGTDDSRLLNTGIGGAAGVAVPAIAAAGRGIKAAIDPLTEGGRNLIVGRAINEAAGPGGPAARTNLQNAKPLIPNSLPTAAETAESPGISALQRGVSAADPEAYGRRGMEQAAARSAALRGVAGDDSQMAMAKALREKASKPLYDAAAATPIDTQLAKAMKPQIDNLMERPAMQAAVEKAKEIFGERSVTLAKGGSPEGLQLVKQALDDMIEKAGEASSSIGKNQLRALQQTRSDLISTMETLTPKLREADEAFRAGSKPINQMQVGRYLEKEIAPALSDYGALASETGAKYARALRDAPGTIKDATGRSAKSLADIMTPDQVGTLENIAKDLGRKANAQNLGRGVGSDTVQKLSMTNLAQRSGVPVGVLELPGVGRGLKWVYENTDQKMREQMAKTLLDPQKTAEVMGKALPRPQAEALAKLLRAGTTPAALSAPSLVNAQQ